MSAFISPTFGPTPLLNALSVSVSPSGSYRHRPVCIIRHATPPARLVMSASASQQGSASDFLPIAPAGASPQQPYHHVNEGDTSDIAADLASDGIVPPSGGSTGDSGRGDDSGSDGGAASNEDELSALLSEKNASINDLPKEILTAYRSKIIPLWAVSNYLVARANPLSRIMLPIGAMRDRFLADKLFLLKILIEEGIGLCGKLSAEYQQRRSAFWKEGEFVFANVLIALLADFALVFFPAPSLSLNRPSSASSKGFTAWLSRMSSDLPSNIFQTDRPFTLGQRAGGFALKFSQLFAVGFLCCFAGVVITNGLVSIREKVDSSYKPATSTQKPLQMSLLYATFLGASSGTRYQFINGIENHIFPRAFAKAPAVVEQVATFALRYANTFWGSQQWVMFARFANLQKLKESDSDLSDAALD